jgi:hypothetical protein
MFVQMVAEEEVDGDGERREKNGADVPIDTKSDFRRQRRERVKLESLAKCKCQQVQFSN